MDSNAQLSADSSAAGPGPGRRLWWCAILGGVLGGGAVLGLRAFQSDPTQTESMYCRGIYPLVRTVLAPVRFVPFSVAEAVLCLTALGVSVKVLRLLLGKREDGRRREGWARAIRRGLGWAVALVGLGLFTFELTWGFHHARQPFAHHAGWTVRPSSTGELAELVRALAAEAREERGRCLHEFEGPDEEAVGFALSGGFDGDPELHTAWKTLGEQYPSLAGRPVPVRRPWLSALMSRMGIAGIYSPFTAEAHVNAQVPDTQVAFVTAHEVAHGRGFAREDEANFIAYLVCRASTLPPIRYSGSLQALSHARGALRRADPDLSRELDEQLDEGVRADLVRQAEFWRSKQTVLWDWSTRANDAYLKSQGQAEGVASYGRMVDLLLARRTALGQ